MAALDPDLTHEFGEAEIPTRVLIKLPTQDVAVASYALAHKSDKLKLIKDIAGVEPNPVFSAELRPDISVASPDMPGQVTGLEGFYEVPAESVKKALDLAGKIKEGLGTEPVAVIPVPPATPAIGPADAVPANVAAPTPDLRALQQYLGPGPDGVNAFLAWQYPGGDGTGVTLIDIEGGWRLSHESLYPVRFNHIAGEMIEGDAWKNHGTAVIGMLAGRAPYAGAVTGVCPGARVGMVSAFEKKEPLQQRVANQILVALRFLTPGDVLLIELQRPGPKTNFQSNDEQKGYIPVSYWPDVRAAIRKAVESGVCVIEVAGNGGESLDDKIYEDVFDQSKGDNDCGAVFVGAGAPAGGAFGEARSRLYFSNYGHRVDCQGWGELVTTAGYGDLWSVPNEPDRVYTSRFMGTSSAGPIVAGVVACLQGRHKAVYGAPLHPFQVRAALANMGWSQAEGRDAPIAQRIGPMPDLGVLFRLFGLV